MSIGSALALVHQALNTLLRTDAQLINQATVLEESRLGQQVQPFPCIALQIEREEQQDALDVSIFMLHVSIHIRDRARDEQRAYTLVQRVHQLLHAQPLTLTPLSHLGSWYETTERVREQGQDIHLLSRFVLYVQEAA